MAISTLAKVNIYFHNENKEKLIQKLQELGSLHIVDFKETITAQANEDLITSNNISDPELEKKLNDLSFAIGCLSPFEEAKKGMLGMFVGKKVLLSKKEYNDVLKSFDEVAIVKDVMESENEEHILLSEITNNEAVMRELAPWAWLETRVEDVKDTPSVCVRLGKLPMNKLGELKTSLEAETALYELYEGSAGTESSAYILLAYAKEVASVVENILTVVSFERKEFPNETGKVSQLIDKYKKKDERDDARLSEIGKNFTEYAKSLPKLKVIYDHLFSVYDRKKIQKQFGGTENVSMIEGFVETTALPKLRESVENEFKYAQVEELEIGANDKVPTKLKNDNKGVRAFEVVFDLYGMPVPGFFDSTPYILPFFLIFFGFCLTDAGYGLVIAIAAAILMKKYKVVFGNSKLMMLSLLSGAATIIIGAITGGWFGDFIDPKYMPDSLSWLVRMKDSVMLFDPMTEPMTFFKVALVLGYVHLVYGNALSFFKTAKDGKLADALCNKMTWISLLVSFAFWRLSLMDEPKFLTSLNSLSEPFKYWFFASGLSVILFTDRTAKWPIRIIKGTYSLYGGTAYIGDTLSYLRLLALGLSSTVIAMVINMLCKLLVTGLPWYIGYLLAILLFIGGHLFNIAVSALGAFVHTLRLNYVEFFTKFFEGGGKKFVPFEQKLNYMIFNEEDNGKK